MQIRVKAIKLKSSTIIETIIALLVLMISFSAGMVIYTKVLMGGVKLELLRTDNELMFLMDSLTAAGSFEPAKLVRKKKVFEVTYATDERFPQLLAMKITCIDDKNVVLAEHLRWVKKHEAGEN